ncbi:MAG TPA: glycosyltransferase 87 family protein [Solirubrobacteraceae bacterium]|nr:glycosyltransferase 87 family protein [Solirubrobacteraceae bacterium]
MTARREVLAGAVLAGMVGLGAKLAFDAAAMPSKPLVFSLAGRGFEGWISGPFHGLGTHLTWDGFYAMVLGLCALWIAACALARHVRLAWALAAVGLLHALFALAPPIGLSDSFNYIAVGRLLVEHGLNPYTHTLSEVPQDPAFAYATWPDWPNPYGPLATLAFAPLGLTGVAQALWLTKAAAAAASLALVALTAAGARALERPVVPAVVFVGLNPVVLVYGVAGAHVDLVLVALTMAGVHLALTGRPRRAGAALAAGAATKVTGVLPLAFALAGSRRRRDLALGAGIAGALVLAVSLTVFGPHLLSGVADQREVTSPRSVPGLIARGLGFDGVPTGFGVAGVAGFAAATAWLLRETWRGRDWIECAGWATVALLAGLTWLMPWYVIWLLPLAALAPGARLRHAAVALTLFVVVVRTIPLG